MVPHVGGKKSETRGHSYKIIFPPSKSNRMWVSSHFEGRKINFGKSPGKYRERVFDGIERPLKEAGGTPKPYWDQGPRESHNYSYR